MNQKLIFATPFTGLGLYNGFRGNRWLRNRITVFKQFVIPSLLNQTDRDFLHWIQWRPEERSNPQVIALGKYLETIPNYRFMFTFGGAVMYDDKYPHKEAHNRLANSLSDSLAPLLDLAPEETIIWMMQPSDDCYDREVVASVKAAFSNNPEYGAVSFEKGFLANYTTKEVVEYDPATNPPFAAIKFTRKVFFDPAAHLQHIGLKEDAGPYLKGTPLPSHEYLPKCLNTMFFEGRGFLVGTHLDNISTTFDHPYGKRKIEGDARDIVLDRFGILTVPAYKPPFSLRRKLFHALPYQVKRKLRYWGGDCNWFLRPLFGALYNFLRG